MTVYIYGAGKKGSLLVSQLRYYMTYSESSAFELRFIDMDILKIGVKINDVEVISLENAINEYSKGDIVISTVPDKTRFLEDLFGSVFGGIDLLKYLLPETNKMDLFTNIHPFNHYESPYPDERIYKDLSKNKDIENTEVLEIDFKLREQAILLEKFLKFEKPTWENGYYNINNGWFGYASSDSLYYMMRYYKPDRIIEIGSGYSTAAMLDVNAKYFGNSIKIICIEPFPTRLYNIIDDSVNIELYKDFVQNISLGLFKSLKKNDILFIDSSHVAKHGGDVNYELFEILPCLKKGVHIHFHDILYPFQYPLQWIKEGRTYNETYMLRAFLMNNKNYDIELFNGRGKLFENNGIEYPRELKYLGDGSMWIKKNI